LLGDGKSRNWIAYVSTYISRSATPLGVDGGIEMVNKIFGTALMGAAFALTALASGPDSGLNVGEGVTPFNPKHVTGPNKGSNACPPCTYGARPQVQVWVNGDNMRNVVDIAKLLNDSVKEMKASELKAFVIFLVDKEKAGELEAMLPKLAERIGVYDIALATLPKDNNAVGNYKVNVSGDVKNTVFVYRDKKVVAKYVNLKADEKGLAALSGSIKTVTQ
jgi:hypothetical protein